MKCVAVTDLPQTTRDQVALIGLPATVRLVEAMPGLRFPVPKGCDGERFDQLVEACGLKAAKALVKAYGGTLLYVASCKDALRLARNRQIVAEYNAGSSVTDLALFYKLSYRQIETILSRTDTTVPAASNQVELF